MQDFLKIAMCAARKAGKVHKKHYNTKLDIKTKKTSFDLVTVADIEAEKVIVEIIRKHYKDHNILAEEQKYEKTGSEYMWVIDPLDGTNNFANGLPIFCVSIALAKNGVPIVGVVYDALRDEMFYAEQGKGTFLNRKRVAVANVSSLDKSLLITGFYYDRGEKMVETLGHIRQFLERKIVGLRRLGAAALDLSYVACGRATGFWEFQLSPWDFAAGLLLIEEAGGKVTGRTGEQLTLKEDFIVSSNGLIHEDMLKVINS